MIDDGRRRFDGCEYRFDKGSRCHACHTVSNFLAEIGAIKESVVVVYRCVPPSNFERSALVESPQTE
jgi:hypothetical protein